MNHLDLPVLCTVVLVVEAAGGVLDDDGVAAAEVVVEPLRVGRAEIRASMADVAPALIAHRSRSAVDEDAAVVDADGVLDFELVALGRIDRNAVGG